LADPVATIGCLPNTASELSVIVRQDKEVAVGSHHRLTLLDLVDRNAAEHPNLIATIDGESRLSWWQYRERARAIALVLLDLGVRHGDVVGLHMVNRADHVLADIGALMAGAVPASFYNTLAAEQLAYMAADSAATVAIVDAAQLPRWQAIRDRLPALRHLLVLDVEPGTQLPPNTHRFEPLVARAEVALDTRGLEVDEASYHVSAGDALTIVYTSGTTGAPKGTILTHAGALSVLEEIHRELVEHRDGPVPVGWSTVSYLPLAHIAERVFSHYNALNLRLTVTYVRDPARLPQVLPATRPNLFLGVPRVWERMYAAVRERVRTSRSPIRRRLGATAISVAREVGTALLTGQTPRRSTRFRRSLLERLVYRRVRAALGLDRVELAVSGAASLPPDVMAFFAGVGVTIIEVYGMTETCAMLAASPLGAPRLGSVGHPVPGVELKIAPDGEVLARGPNITPGYLNRPEATAEAIDASGWLHTGDVGVFDDDGYLYITGRKKELINTASGKTISPTNVEQALAAGSDLVGSVYVHGDDKPCLVALVTLDPNWRDWCAARGIAAKTLTEAINDGRVRLEVARSIGAGNSGLSRVEQVKNWTLLPDVWSIETGELTPTLKLKRAVIAERYREEIEELYDPLTAEAWAEDE
jgi:long-chain acyl-CoA synthetase